MGISTRSASIRMSAPTMWLDEGGANLTDNFTYKYVCS